MTWCKITGWTAEFSAMSLPLETFVFIMLINKSGRLAKEVRKEMCVFHQMISTYPVFSLQNVNHPLYLEIEKVILIT